MRRFAVVACLFILLSYPSARSIHAATWHVAPSGSDAAAGTNWATAKQTIQAAIDAAAPSDTVLASNGVYETGGRAAPGFALTNRVVIDKAITLQSVNGPAFTTIRGSGPHGPAAVRCVWMINGATLVGFTLTNGATQTSGDSITELSGGGLWAQSIDAIVSNCILSGNSANVAGGGAIRATLNNCTLTGNSAGFNGGGARDSTLNNCTLTGNSAGFNGGGAILSTLNNCTLTGNSAGLSGGGDRFGTLNNCIVYFNDAPDEPNASGSAVTASCTTPDPGGVGNITNDPLFVSLATTNLQLAANSPCINAGSSALAVGATDLAGNPRILGGRVDMGAFEAPVRASVSNPDGPITIVDTNFAIPNPSIIRVDGVTGTVAALRVTLNGLTHTYPDDLDIILVSPGFLEGVMLMSDAGGEDDLNSAVLTFDDASGAVLPDAAQITNGVYPPTDYDVDTIGGITFVTNLASLLADGVNGDWRLFIYDDEAGDIGSLASWSLEFEWYVDPTNHFVNIANATPAWPFATWATAATNIQDAIDAATAADTVLVSNGVYQTGGRVVSPWLLTNRVVIDKAITVQSVNGPAVTAIRGEKDPLTTNGDAAVRCVWMTSDTTLAGFTLTNGATRTTGDEQVEDSGGGVWAQSASAVVSNCTLAGNSAGRYGGGAFRSTLNHCALTGNASSSYGGGVFLGTLNHCTLVGNSAIEGGGADSSTLDRCRLTGNSASTLGGGAYYGTMANCTLTGNSAGASGGGASFSTLNNCTLTGNSAGLSGGGDRFGTLKNCIVYFNNAPNEPNASGSAVTASCTTPDPGGDGNITNDPLFVSLATTNLQLAANSPCINLGNNAFAAGTTDLAGNPRIANTVVDMGAYEFQGAANPDYDNDGWSNADEYIAATDPTNGASFFPKAAITNAPAGRMSLVIAQTSTGRVYGVFVNTNLLDSPQTWTLVPPEQTGTASALTLTITNTLPSANYRTGVRLP